MSQHNLPSQWEPYRAAFEADAGPLGFDLTRRESITGEPWMEYADEVTGQRFGGFIAGAALSEQGAGEAAQPARVVDAFDVLLTDEVIEAATLAHEESNCHDLIGPMSDAMKAAVACAKKISTPPAVPTLFNGLTQAETDASASVNGLTAAPTPSPQTDHSPDGGNMVSDHSEQALNMVVERVGLVDSLRRSFTSYGNAMFSGDHKRAEMMAERHEEGLAALAAQPATAPAKLPKGIATSRDGDDWRVTLIFSDGDDAKALAGYMDLQGVPFVNVSSAIQEQAGAGVSDADIIDATRHLEYLDFSDGHAYDIAVARAVLALSQGSVK